MKTAMRPLGELCDRHINSIDPANTPDKEFWYIDISAVSSGRKRIENAQRVLGKNASVRAKQVIRRDDVLVSTTRPNLNSVALVPQEYDSQVCSTGFCVLRCGPELDPDYLFSYVQSPNFVQPLSDLVQGALYPAVTDRQVFQQNIPWIPLNYQRRIASHLKFQLATIEEARNAVKIQLEELTSLANAIIRQSVEQPEIASVKLGDVLDEVKKGIGATWADYPVLGATRAGLALAKEPVGKSPERYKPVLQGTVFYNPMRIMIGSIALVDNDDTPGITSPDYVALRGKPGKVDSRWFYYWLRSPYGVSCIASLARGAVRERMLFNRLAEGSIELPPYDVQVAAATALAELKPMRAAIGSQLREINLLPGKILSKAFEIEA